MGREASSRTRLGNALSAVKDVLERKSLQRRQRRKPLFRTAHEEKKEVHQEHGAESWRGRLVHWLHEPLVQNTLIFLLLVDVIVVMVELFMEAEFPSCKYVVRDAISCCETSGSGSGSSSSSSSSSSSGRMLFADWPDFSEGHAERRLAGALCEVGTSVSTPAGCDSHKYATAHKVHDYLFYTSVAILGLFAVELMLLIAALGRSFCKNKLYVLDFVVVFASLGLEIGLRMVEQDELAALSGLIIFARIWRLIRVGHGLYTTGSEINEREVHELKHHLLELEQELAALGVGAHGPSASTHGHGNSAQANGHGPPASSTSADATSDVVQGVQVVEDDMEA